MALEEEADGMNKETDLKMGVKASLISISISLFLALAKGIAGFLSGSLVLISDALESASDIISGLASFFSLKLSQRKPNEKFPYGYYKAENISALFISIIITYGAIKLLFDGYQRIFALATIQHPIISLTVAASSGLVAFVNSAYLKRVSKEINSQSLDIMSKDRLKDVFVSFIVFITILLSNYKIPYIEGLITIIISMIVLKFGLFSLRDSIFALMDVSPDKILVKNIEKQIKLTPGVESLNNLKLRRSGPFIFGEVSIKIKKFANVNKAHEIADQIERKVKKRFKDVNSFTIHIEPYESLKHKVAIPIKKPKGLDSVVVEHFGRADYFLFVETERKSIRRFYSKPNPNKSKSVRAGLSTVHFLLKEKVDILITKEIGEISFHSMRDNLIDIYKIKGRTAKEVIDNFLKNKLERLTKQTRKKD